MATWNVVSQKQGYRLSPAYDISCAFDSLIAVISWNSVLPTNTTLVVETNVSYDKGVTWQGWRTVTNGAIIEGVHGNNIDLTNARLQVKESFTSSDSSQPMINDLTIDLKAIIFLENKGDVELKPELWIKKIGNGDVSLTNLSNGGKEFKFTSLVDAETVYVDNENEYMETDLLLAYRYGNFNDNYLELIANSKSELKLVGNFTVNFRYQFKTKQG